MNTAEAMHTLAAVVVLSAAVVCALFYHTTIAIWLALVTVPYHVYPVMLQRRNRGRVSRLRDALGKTDTQPSDRMHTDENPCELRPSGPRT